MAEVNDEHVNEFEHPKPDVLQPDKYKLQALSEVAVVLSEQTIGLQAEFAQMHYFDVSVVAAGPQANLLYDEHAALETHPAPLVVQVEITAEQAESVVSVIGNSAQVKVTQDDETVLQPQVIVVAPEIGTLLH